MKSIGPSTPYGYTIFCDDVRQEAGGKTSHMGVYKGELTLNMPLPASLPKFCFVIHYFERANESTDPVSIHVYMPGEDAPSFTAELQLDEFRTEFKSKASEMKVSDSDLLMSVTFALINAPCEFKSEGPIRVRAYRGDLEIRLGTLSVVSKPAEDSSPKVIPPDTKKRQPKKVARRKSVRSRKAVSSA